MNQRTAEWIDSRRDAFREMLQSWVRTPSVKGEPRPGAPFGGDVRKMLDLAMKDAREMGFAVRDFAGTTGALPPPATGCG